MLDNLLGWVLALPLVGFLLMLVIPRSAEDTIKKAALGLSIAIFVLSLGLIAPFSNGNGRYFETNIPWVDSPAIRYHVEPLTKFSRDFLRPCCEMFDTRVLKNWRLT